MQLRSVHSAMKKSKNLKLVLPTFMKKEKNNIIKIEKRENEQIINKLENNVQKPEQNFIKDWPDISFNP